MAKRTRAQILADLEAHFAEQDRSDGRATRWVGIPANERHAAMARARAALTEKRHRQRITQILTALEGELANLTTDEWDRLLAMAASRSPLQSQVKDSDTTLIHHPKLSVVQSPVHNLRT